MEITAIQEQEVLLGQNVLFTESPIPSTQKCIIHREGSGIVTLRGITRNQNRARFLVEYSANIAVPTGGTAGEISLAIAIDGEPDLASLGAATPTVVDAYFNVAGQSYIDIPAGCCGKVSLENTSGTAIDTRNVNLIVTRVA